MRKRIGGTGKQGTGLALRWAKSHDVIRGSRAPERAQATSQEGISKLRGGAGESVSINRRYKVRGAGIRILGVA